MPSTNRFKLSVMFFLEYVIWGAWLPLLNLYLGNYLKFTGDQQAWIASAFALAAITGWLFGGQMADRYFEQSKFLAFSHLVGGLAMLALAFTTSFPLMFGLMLVHCFFFVPTLSMTNAIALANIKDAQKEFGSIRLWGTIGWIAASWPYIFILVDWAKVPAVSQAGGLIGWFGIVFRTPLTGEAMRVGLTSIFWVSGLTSLVLSAFCLTLPRTPPAKGEGARFAPLEALSYLTVPALFVLFVVTFFDAVVLYNYFFWSGSFYSKMGLPENWITPAMSLGQLAEIPAMALLGFFLKKFGWRTTMILGVVAQVFRFGIYAVGARYPGSTFWLTMVILSNIIHGFAYALYFAAVYIYVDENFPKDVRTSAQSLFNLLILGVGQFVSNVMSGALKNRLTTTLPGGETNIDYFSVFLVPLGISVVSVVLLVLFFHPKEKPAVAAAVA